ncbi:MAG: Lrp/AsnC family transcriptional regulator [Alphaproteobacteria bacterium]
MPGELDDIDRKILDCLQKDASLSGDRLAARVGGSRSAIQRRVARLRAQGVIEREIVTVSPEAVGRNMSFLVAVSLEREDRDIVRQFRQRIADMEEIQQCFYVTGEADFILVLTARDMHEYDRIVQDLFVDNPHIRRFHTNVVIERVKSGLFLPLT